MKNIKLLLLATIVLSALAFTAIKSVYWKVKENYSVKFNGGSFTGLKAVISFDEEHPEKSKITATIDARTYNSGQRLRDEHTKEALEAENFPLITFVSTAIKKTETGYEATGNLTLKGVIKEVVLPFSFDSKKMSDRFPFIDKEIFSGRLTIIPKDFNITKEGTPKEVTVMLDIPVTQ